MTFQLKFLPTQTRKGQSTLGHFSNVYLCHLRDVMSVVSCCFMSTEVFSIYSGLQLMLQLLSTTYEHFLIEIILVTVSGREGIGSQE